MSESGKHRADGAQRRTRVRSSRLPRSGALSFEGFDSPFDGGEIPAQCVDSCREVRDPFAVGLGAPFPSSNECALALPGYDEAFVPQECKSALHCLNSYTELVGERFMRQELRAGREFFTLDPHPQLVGHLAVGRAYVVGIKPRHASQHTDGGGLIAVTSTGTSGSKKRSRKRRLRRPS